MRKRIKTKVCRTRITGVIACVIPMLGACAEGRVFSSGAVETKPEAIQTFNATSSGQADGTPILLGRYRAWVDAPNIGLRNLCQGELTINVSAAGGMKLDGTIFCDVLGGQNLGEMMPSDDGPKEKLVISQYPEAGMIMRVPNSGAGQRGPRFDPPRPMFLGPLIQDPSKFGGYSYSETSRVSGTSHDGTKTLNSQGEFTFQVHAINQSYTSPDLPGKTFDNVMEWSVSANGFDDESRGAAMIFDEMRIHVNLRPLSIPLIKIKTKASYLAPPETQGQAGMADRFLGPIEFNMSLMSETRFD